MREGLGPAKLALAPRELPSEFTSGGHAKMSNAKWVLVAGDFVVHGGMDRANYALAAFLAKTGNHVTLVTHRAAADLLNMPGVDIDCVRRRLGSHFLGSWSLSRAGRKHEASGARLVVNGGNCAASGANWIHYVHAAYRPELPASRVQRLKSGIVRPLDLNAERAAVSKAEVVICNSDRTRHDVIELLGVAPERAKTVYYGCDGDLFQPARGEERKRLRQQLGWPESRPIVLFIGALGDRRKGFDTLFDAWRRRLCRERKWDAMLVVVGRGGELALWKKRASEAGLSDHIRFLGFRTDVPDLVRAADALVHPARYEAYGLGVQEALCCGLPAIVSSRAGIAERYPDDLTDLLLSDPDDADELAERLQNWRANHEVFSSRVVPFARSLRARSWDDMARDVRDTNLSSF